jgi:S1-C subfamily serine protease
MTQLTEISQQMGQVTTQASASIVRIEARRRLPATGIIWSADGLILTANHIIQREEEIPIGLDNGRTFSAKLIGRDPTTDLALLQADATDLAPLTEANKLEMSVGNLVLALGRPGHTIQATLGIISALGAGWRTGGGGLIDRYIQTDVTMYPGFSGGPLIDAAGALIGLNSSALAHGVSLTIPTATLARIADTLRTHGRIRRGYLGVSTQRVHLPDAVREAVGQKRGLLIVSVENDTPASAAGLSMGDTIVSVAGSPVQNHDDLLTQLSGDRVGTAVAVQYLRGGALYTADVTVGERP